MSEQPEKIIWNKDWGDVAGDAGDPYQYRLTGPWLQYHSEESLEQRSRQGLEDGNRLFRELARSLLVGHAAIVVLSINITANLLGSDSSISLMLPAIMFLGVCGIAAASSAQFYLARHAQAVGAGYEAFKFWRFPNNAGTIPDHDALDGFEKAHANFRVLWTKQRKTYRRLLITSLLLFGLAMIVAVIYMIGVAAKSA